MLTGIELNFEGLEIKKLKKNATFFVYFADDSKILVQAKHLKIFEFFQKMVHSQVLELPFVNYRGKKYKKMLRQQKNNETVSSKVNILLMVAQNPTIHSIF